MTIVEEIRTKLFELQDVKYKTFQSNLMPTVPPESVIGVRTPALRKLAKELSKRPDVGDFLSDLPHRYYEENNIHGYILGDYKDFDAVIRLLEHFLPYVNNWATCDTMMPKVFHKHTEALLPHVERWIAAGETYTVRFAVDVLMNCYLEEHFEVRYADWVADLRSEEYYVNMMRAWYFATALAKQWQVIVPYIENQRLDVWTHNKTIQKAVESYRITPEQKDVLRTLRRKGGR